MTRFHLDDVVYSDELGYGEVDVVEDDGKNVHWPVRATFNKDGAVTRVWFTHAGWPSYQRHGKIIHARERWKKEVNFAIMCLASFAAGLAWASYPWT